MRESRYDLSPNVHIVFKDTGAGGDDEAWIVQQPNRVTGDVGAQVRLSPAEWLHLVERARMIRALAKPTI